MLILNGKELEQTPHLIVSFGGGMGGYSYHYRYIRVSSIDNGTLNASGFSVPPSLLKDKNIFAKTDNSIHCFNLVNYAKERRDQIRELLLKGSLANAKKTLVEWNNNSGNKLTDIVMDIPRQNIIACGNWMYTGPDLSKIIEDYVICHEENFHNEPVIDEKDDMPLAFGTLEKAREHFDQMIENDGLYIVHRTEEIVYAQE